VSVWAKHCEALSLPDDERQELNTFIDKLYSDMDDGEHAVCIVGMIAVFQELIDTHVGYLVKNDFQFAVAGFLQCFDAVGWAAGRASGL